MSAGDHKSRQEPAAQVSAATRFAQAAEAPAPGLAREFVEFLRTEKKWWLAPILIVLALFALAIILLGSPLAPFIYPVF